MTSPLPVRQLQAMEMRYVCTEPDVVIKTYWMEAEEKQRNTALRCGPLKQAASLRGTTPPVVRFSATETVMFTESGSSPPQHAPPSNQCSTAVEERAERACLTMLSTLTNGTLTSCDNQENTHFTTASPQPTSESAEHTSATAKVAAPSEVDTHGTRAEQTNCPIAGGAVDALPRRSVGSANPALPPLEAAPTEATAMESAAAREPIPAASENAPQGLTVAAIELAGGAESHNEGRSTSSKILPRRRSKTSSLDDPTDLTEEEEKRIAMCVQETVRLNFVAPGLVSSPVGTMTPASAETYSPTLTGPVQIKSLLVEPSHSGSVPPQTRLSNACVSSRESNHVAEPRNSASPRRRHSARPRMTSASAFLPSASPKHSSKKPPPPAVRLSLARLGRRSFSCDEQPAEESASAESTPVSPTTTGDDVDYNTELSALLHGSEMVSRAIGVVAANGPTTTVAVATLHHSPVSILRKNSSFTGSSRSSVPGSSRTSMTDLDLSGYDQHEGSHLSEPEDDADAVTGDGDCATTGSCGSCAHSAGISRPRPPRRSRRWSTSRHGKQVNVRDTPRSVGFVGDGLADAEKDAQTSNELDTQRILEKMRSRRRSSVSEQK